MELWSKEDIDLFETSYIYDNTLTKFLSPHF